ncbi:hypothetical protein L362_02678 [Enterobacter sp. MGH 16]|nr:hypothetical protein L362_02678 [Enterobacter sp. MGH 16]
MFPGESMEQVTQCSGEHNTLSHDFVIVERVYHNDKIKIGVLIEPAMNKRAASEKGVNPRISLKFKLKLLCKTSV